MSKNKADTEIFNFTDADDDDGLSDAGAAGGALAPPLPPEDAHAEMFREASVRGKLRGEEAKFGKVLAETNIDIIFADLLDKMDSLNAAEQEAVLDALQTLQAHPLLDSQMFDGMEDSNLNPEAVADPAQRAELRNRLELRNQLKQRLQQKLGMTPRPLNL